MVSPANIVKEITNNLPDGYRGSLRGAADALGTQCRLPALLRTAVAPLRLAVPEYCISKYYKGAA